MTAMMAKHPVAETMPLKIVHGIGGLDALLKPGVDAIMWERDMSAVLTQISTQLPQHTVQDGRFYLNVNDIARGVRATFEAWDMPPMPALEWIIHDTQALAHRFSNILDIHQLRLRVELVRDNACRRFHRDNVRARLITTYVGPGSEYVISDTPEHTENIKSIPTGCPAIFKGKTWLDLPSQPILHRSPQIESTSQTRLVIVLDDGPVPQL